MKPKDEKPRVRLDETTSIAGAKKSPSAGSTPPCGGRPMTYSSVFESNEVVAGRYRVVRFLARGGMGEVYEAEDLELGEHVALKTIQPLVADQPGVLERFKREIQLARKVTHPNVCRIFDLGHHRFAEVGARGALREVTFLTMELLEGETLSQRIKRLKRIPLPEALPIIRQVAAALCTAHQASIIHRDFKSSNVILVPSKDVDRAVVTDFGLARGTVDSGNLEASLTTSGDIVGTPAYMAPEQLEGGPIGPAVDIYALGVVMYEMATGRWPFIGDSPFKLAIQRLREDPPSPVKFCPEVDPIWAAVILKCLERDPLRRFENVTEVAAALSGERVLVKHRSPRRMAWVVTAAVVLALAIGYSLSRFVLTPGRDRPDLMDPSAITEIRRSIAVLGFKNLGGPEADWLATAVSEMLRTELAAGEKLRTVPGENVARMKVELSLADTDSLAQDTLVQVNENLGADLVVLGSYLVLGEGGKLRLDLRLQDTVAGEMLSSVAETGTVDDLFDLVTKAGEQLRGRLGVGEVTLADAGGIRASLPSDTGAARLYSEGLARLRVFEALAARDLLQQAASIEPEHPLIHSELATAWSALGYDEKAQAEAKLAFELSKNLAREERLSVEGLYNETSRTWEKAAEIYSGLFVFFPDNLDYGLRLASAQISEGRAEDALATVSTLRDLPPPISNDSRIDLEEAKAAKALTDYERQRDVARRAASKAQARGARLLYAEARHLEGSALVNLGQLRWLARLLQRLEIAPAQRG